MTANRRIFLNLIALHRRFVRASAIGINSKYDLRNRGLSLEKEVVL